MATNYTAGDLNVSIFGDSVKAEKSIDNIISKLNSLQQALTVFSNINSQSIGTNLSQTFTQISTAINGIDTNGITKLNSLGNATKYLQQFITETQKINSQELDSKLSNLFRGLNSAVNLVDDKTLAKLEKIGNSVSALSKFKGGSLAGLANSNNGKNSKNGGFGLLNIAGWTSVLYLARRLGSTVANILQKGADYTETLNLWEVAMKGNNDQATDFVNKMNEAYGISKKTLMNAQAIFKNMLGGLGGITDQMAYQLSEGVTQMAVDYASLFNVQFEQAFTKFQSALAGQVRPIRSVSGFDITENTLYELYKTLGGTKTIRQLSITEKRLLSILAIFKQMEASGAIGDLSKTMGSFANQSRVMAESLQEVLSYSGLILTHWLQTSGIMVKINGFLIFLGNTLEAVADDMGAIQSYGGSIFEETENSALNANKAVEELQGKLLDFDKFRSMSSGDENQGFALDETILKAFSGYDTILANATSEASEFAKQLGVASGIFDENGVFQPERWQEITTEIEKAGKALGIAFGSFSALNIIKGLGTSFGVLKGAISNLGGGSTLGAIAVFAVLYSKVEDFKLVIDSAVDLIVKFISSVLEPLGIKIEDIGDLFDKYTQAVSDFFTIGVMLAKPFIYELEALFKIIETVIEVIKALFESDYEGLKERIEGIWSDWITEDFYNKISEPITRIQNKFGEFFKWAGNGLSNIWNDFTNTEAYNKITEFFTNIKTKIGKFFDWVEENIKNILPNLSLDFGKDTSSSDSSSGIQKVAKDITSTFENVGEEVGNFFEDIGKGINNLFGIKLFASGASNIDSGTMFIAGESGKTETVFNGNNGRTNVANIQQMKSAFYQALVEYGKTQNNSQPIVVEVDGNAIFQATRKTANLNGYDYATVR